MAGDPFELPDSTHGNGGTYFIRGKRRVSDQAVRPDVEPLRFHLTDNPEILLSTTRSLSAAAVLVLMAFPGMALARGFSAFNGNPYTPAEASCWSHSYGSVTNNCTTKKYWCMPSVVDTTGNYTVTVWAYAPSSTANVGCQATGINPEVTWQWSSAWTYLSTFGSSQPISLTGPYVPAGGQLYVCCEVGPGGRINNYLW